MSIPLAALLIAAATPVAAQVYNSACPAGTKLFGWGGKYGCVNPRTSKIVTNCLWWKKACPSAWKNAGMTDKRGYRLCCLPRPKQTLLEMLDEAYPNRSCYYEGEAPFCKGKCPPGYSGKYPSRDGKGMPPGFGSKCLTGMKVYCCKFGPH